MKPAPLHQLAAQLHHAWAHCFPIAPLTDTHPGLTLEAAYEIQKQLVDMRLQTTGARVIGKKIGVTSQAVMDMLQVHQPDFGMLTSDMVVDNGAGIAINRLIAPKAEGEIAFLLKHGLAGPGVTSADVLAATELVLPCLEIVDSRIRDWQIRIADTVADNASCGCVVIGDQGADPRRIDLSLTGMVLEKNGRIATTGAGAAALGHPAQAVAWLANILGQLGSGLLAGEIVLSGSLAAMVPVVPGDYLRLDLSGIGSASVSFI
ncbi:fumarylacetoacetate hydrolase family protein [Kerstersia gyiorum]|jgi:2-oxopent-4-enoate/cis-2-oxohex-4-enoate hydratase|uniref:fumarylacetoacetate hydrolase family protein n=1 Tax=Kerstersia gyiorum TaxID=206506 RepID=UPI00242F04C4|nr:fumarylacetoacetate hydrolase family protein [Kerstersia gyiorum]MCH4273119.1 fumarylacetoacetate hydrolase family protein [Kerstersia gyiorum]MCI1228472.1 fumarylacetoacetate hydrolase family protein [Kerstersia gyiorum]